MIYKKRPNWVEARGGVLACMHTHPTQLCMYNVYKNVWCKEPVVMRRVAWRGMYRWGYWWVRGCMYDEKCPENWTNCLNRWLVRLLVILGTIFTTFCLVRALGECPSTLSSYWAWRFGGEVLSRVDAVRPLILWASVALCCPLAVRVVFGRWALVTCPPASPPHGQHSLLHRTVQVADVPRVSLRHSIGEQKRGQSERLSEVIG